MAADTEMLHVTNSTDLTILNTLSVECIVGPYCSSILRHNNRSADTVSSIPYAMFMLMLKSTVALQVAPASTFYALRFMPDVPHSTSTNM